MPRHTDEQLLEVCKLCISYLHDKHSSELGLFRSSVAQTDVRALQTQIIQFSYAKFRDDPDPHLVAEVLQTSFKNLTYPLLHEVYQDIVNTDLDDEDFDLSETSIQSWIVKLPPAKFNLTSALFRLLSRLAGIDESDSNLIQLAYCIAPSICRPINSAYMSIRHMEDLRKIRPVISFIMENYDEIFTDGLSPLTPTKSDASANRLGSFSYDKTDDISNMMSSSMVIDSGVLRAASNGGDTDGSSSFKDDASMSSMDESVDEPVVVIEPKDPNSLSPRSLALIRPNLKLTIPTSFPPATSYDTMSVSSAGSLLGGSLDSEGSGNGLQHYSEGEWSVLESLLLSTATAFLDFDTRGEAMQVDGISHTSSSTGSPSLSRSATPASSTAVPSSSSVGLHGGAGQGPATGGAHSQSDSAIVGGHIGATGSSSSKNRRRKMVADCKAMRVQIFEFEQEWTRKHNRIPKSFERGSMETVYTRYRKLKKEIRDLSATDLQRAMRGYLSRKRHGRVAHRAASVDKTSAATGNVNGSGKTSAVKRADYANNFFVAPGTATAASVGAAEGLFPGSNIPSSLYATYRDLLEKKRDLKRRLKKFDEDFFENWGRNPKKSDKEVIRPMYQSYHEIKAKLDDLRGTIEASHGPLPEDLQDEVRAPAAGTGTSTGSAAGHASTNADAAGRLGGTSDSAGAKYVSDDEDADPKEGSSRHSHQRAGAGVGAGAADSKGGGAPAGMRPYVADVSSEPKGYLFSVNKNPINVESELEALQIEKRNLHAYLKVYERDFSRMHGRPVTKHADIQPVAHEYQRYKELKNLIRDKKVGSGSK